VGSKGSCARKAGKEAVQESSSSGEGMTERPKKEFAARSCDTHGNNKIQATCSQAYLRIQDA
jgi:hypothetical protein